MVATEAKVAQGTVTVDAVDTQARLNASIPPQMMTCEQLREYILGKYGVVIHDALPKSWRKPQLIACALGHCGPRSKDVIIKAVMDKTGVPLPKSWKVEELWAYLNGKGGKSPKSKEAKAAAVKDYVTKFNKPAPVSYTAEELRVAVTQNKPSASKSNKRADGLTAEVCKGLLKAARANGTEVPAYSKLKADELRALVGQLGLSA